MKISTGAFLPDDQPVMAAPPNSPTTSHRAKFEEDEMSLLPWAVALKAGGLDGGEEAIPADYVESNPCTPSQALSPVNSVFSSDGSDSSGDEHRMLADSPVHHGVYHALRVHHRDLMEEFHS